MEGNDMYLSILLNSTIFFLLANEKNGKSQLVIGRRVYLNVFMV